MGIYLLVPIVTIAIYFAVHAVNIRFVHIKNLPLLCGLLFLAFFLGLRGNTVGTDTYSYYNLYNSYFGNGLSFALLQKKYLGWSLYCYFLTRLHIDYRGYLFITSLLMMFFVYKTINAYVPKRYSWMALLLFILLYTYCSMFNTFRYYFGITIILYASTKLFQRKYLSYFLLVALGVSIHSTMLIGFALLPIYWVTKRRRSKTGYSLWLILFVVISLLVRPAINLFVQFFPEYAAYATASADSLSTTNRGRTIILRIVELAICLFFVFRNYPEIAFFKKSRFLVFLLLFSNIVGAIYYRQVLLLRLDSTLLTFDFITMAMLITLERKRTNRIVFGGLVFGAFSALFVILLMGNYGDVIPYHL